MRYALFLLVAAACTNTVSVEEPAQGDVQRAFREVDQSPPKDTEKPVEDVDPDQPLN